jgi:PKD repeat protein
MEAGAYFVTLTVTDDFGAPDSDRTIAIIAASELPVADANGPYTGRSGAAVSFDGTGSSDPDGTIVTYEWYFGDGTFGDGPTPSHAYPFSGNFNVTLTVTDDKGKTDSDSTLAIIQPPPCECDLNNDGSCDVSDWLLFSPDWGRTDCNESGVEPCECEMNDVGSCDFTDLVLFFWDWGRDDCPAPVD